MSDLAIYAGIYVVYAVVLAAGTLAVVWPVVLVYALARWWRTRATREREPNMWERMGADLRGEDR